MTLLYVVISIILIGFLVWVHEAGHYTAARLTGVPVVEFAIGFGKRIISKKKNGIMYSLRLIPFGGFVAFADANDENGIGNYYKQPVWKRLITTVSGPLMNFIVAFVVLIVYSMAGGVQQVVPMVGTVTAGSPAAEVGLQPGDKFITINGVQIGQDVDLMRKAINETAGKPFSVVIERNGKQSSLIITPKLDSTTKSYIIGITVGQIPMHMGFGQALSFSVENMVNMVKELLQFLGTLVTQGKGANDVASPIGIVSVMTQQAQQYGLQSFISIAVFLSVNLGLFNLIPFPGLDGSKVIFLLIEAIRGKPVAPEKEGIITAIGFGLFILLFIFLAGRDIARLFGFIK
jgi:regulator of sigma E protease